MKRTRIFTPGPTEVPSFVREALSRPLLHHRTSEFREILRTALEDLAYVYRTEEPIVILTASGTGAMEAALSSITSPGERVLVTRCGKFSARWAEIARAHDLDIVTVDAEAGKPVEPDAVEQALSSGGVSVVFTTHCETSTGVLLDVERIAAVAHDRGALVVVDAITGLVAEDLRTDEWGLDVVIGGSQKGFGIPPGLSFVSIGRAARERIESAKNRTYYLDLGKALSSRDRWDTPFTPSVALVVALAEALRAIRDEGIGETVRRHERNARAVRAAVEALGLRLFASRPANAVTTVVTPEATAEKIVSTMQERYGIRIAQGQGELKGKIIRLGHLGFYDETDMLTLIGALEGTLDLLGIEHVSGAGLEAMKRSFSAK